MKVIKETEFCTIVERSYDKNNKMAMAYVTESATNFYVTIKVVGYAMPSVHKWKVSKKDVDERINDKPEDLYSGRKINVGNKNSRKEIHSNGNERVRTRRKIDLDEDIPF